MTRRWKQFLAAVLSVGLVVASVPAAAQDRADETKPAPTEAPRKDPRKVDLFPRDALKRQATGEAALGLGGRPARGPEKSAPGIPLGDDTHWTTQVLQVGAMGALFGALVGLCGGGKCLLSSQEDRHPAPTPPKSEDRRPSYLGR